MKWQDPIKIISDKNWVEHQLHHPGNQFCRFMFSICHTFEIAGEVLDKIWPVMFKMFDQSWPDWLDIYVSVKLVLQCQVNILLTIIVTHIKMLKSISIWRCDIMRGKWRKSDKQIYYPSLGFLFIQVLKSICLKVLMNLSKFSNVFVQINFRVQIFIYEDVMLWGGVEKVW